MADIQCGKFMPFAFDPQTGRTKWRASISPQPTEGWMQAISHEHGAALRSGVLPSSSLEYSVSLKDIEFTATDDTAPAVAAAFRDFIEKANRTGAKFDEVRRQTLEHQAQEEADRERAKTEQLARLRGKYPDGL